MEWNWHAGKFVKFVRELVSSNSTDALHFQHSGDPLAPSLYPLGRLMLFGSCYMHTVHAFQFSSSTASGVGLALNPVSEFFQPR